MVRDIKLSRSDRVSRSISSTQIVKLKHIVPTIYNNDEQETYPKVIAAIKKYTFNPLILFITAGSKLAQNKTPTNGNDKPA